MCVSGGISVHGYMPLYTNQTRKHSLSGSMKLIETVPVSDCGVDVARRAEEIHHQGVGIPTRCVEPMSEMIVSNM
jgi:hypothetical protein